MADLELLQVPFLDWPNSVLSGAIATPPSSPSDGNAYVVAAYPTGAWTGHTTHIARWNISTAAWEFQTPAAGRVVYSVASAGYLKFDGSAWANYTATSSLQSAYAGGATISLSGTDIVVSNGSDELFRIGSTALLAGIDAAVASAALAATVKGGGGSAATTTAGQTARVGAAANLTGGAGGAGAASTNVAGAAGGTVAISGGAGGDAGTTSGAPGDGGPVTITGGASGATNTGVVGGVSASDVVVRGGDAGATSGMKAGSVRLDGGLVGTGVSGGTNVPGDVVVGADGTRTHKIVLGQSSTGTPVIANGPFVTPPITISDAATITANLQKGCQFICTVAGNRTLDFSFPTTYSNSAVDASGMTGTVMIQQDATGGRTLAFAAKCKTSGDVSLDTTANAVTVLWYRVDGTDVHVRKLSASIISGFVATSRQIIAGTGLSGGGDLTADRTLAVSFGSSAGTAAQGNDSRLSDDRTASSIRTATTAVSVSSATAPSANQVLTAIDSTHASWQTPGAGVTLASTSPADVDSSAAAVGTGTTAARADHKHHIPVATPSSLSVGGSNATGTSTSVAAADHTHALPAFGSTAGTFAQGNDSRLSDSRAPNGSATGDLAGSFPSPTVAALHETSGPTKLTIGAVADHTSGHTQALVRSGSTLVGADVLTLANPGEIAALTLKSMPTPSDMLIIEDAANSFAKAKIPISSLGVSSVTTWSDVHAPPQSPHADDEEFFGTTLSPNIQFMRADTSALVTPSSPVDLWTVVTTAATVRAQQGFRTGWLSIQPYDYNNGANITQAIYVFKQFSVTVGTNMMVCMRISRTCKQTINRDGNMHFDLAADSSGKPDLNNRCGVQYTFSGSSASCSAFTVIGGVSTSPIAGTSRTLGGVYYTGQYDSLAITKRGTTYYFWLGGAGVWECLNPSGTTFSPTVAHVTFQPSVDVGGAVPHTIHHLDYIRRNDTGQLP